MLNTNMLLFTFIGYLILLYILAVVTMQEVIDMLDILTWFCMPLVAWLVGFIILDPKTFTRFFK